MQRSVEGEEDAGGCPLYVDLDGTLLASDTLWECVAALLSRPWILLLAPVWLLAGRAALKRRLAGHASLDPRTLPYREDILAFVAAERGRRTRIVLATACDESLASRIADHLGLFDDVLASDGDRNVAGEGKVSAIQADTSEPFDYIGNSSADLPVWRAAHRAYAVGASQRVLRRLRTAREIEQVFAVTRRPLRDGFRALRPHQWAKNLLIFVPLFLTPEQIGDSAKLWSALLAFLAFDLVASGGYVINDLLDLEADRSHPQKRDRPFASGALPIGVGIALALVLVAGGLALAIATTPPGFVSVLSVYLGSTLFYSAFLKRQLLIDVIVLAGLYTLRVIGGAAAVEIEPTPWLLAFSLFIFLSLAFAKRYSELQLLAARSETHAKGRAYRVEDLDLVAILGATSGYMSVLVLCLYINSDVVRRLYQTVPVLWFLAPILLYWISRIWFLAKRGELPGDPVAFAVRDPVSWLSGALMGAVIFAAVQL